MVDEVEIKNVGGKFGVASEATLQLLLNSMSKDNPSRRRLEQVAERSQRTLVRSTDSVSQRQGILSKSIGSASDAARFFAKEMTDTTTRLSNLVETVIGNGNLLTRGINTVVGAIDDSVDRFRELSSVGASFNNSIFDMITAAQSSYLSLDEFGRLVMNNSATLRTLGGTVTQGAKRFGDLSRQLRTSDFGRNLFSLGYQFGDVNDLLMNYVDIVSRDMTTRIRSDREILLGTQAYSEELERLTKITGMSRREAQEAMNQQMNDQRARMAIAGMDYEQRAKFQANLAMASSASQSLGDVFLDLADGIPNNPTTQRLTAIAPDIVRIARDFKNMDPAEANNALASLSSYLDNYARNMGHDSIQALMAADADFATIFGEIVPSLSRFEHLNAERMAALNSETEAQERLTSTFANFENAWNNLVRSFTSGIMTSDGFMGALADLSSTVLGLTDENTDGSLSWLMTEIKSFVDGFFGENGSITNAIREFTSWLGTDEGRQSVTNFFQVLKDTANSIVDFFLGERVTTGAPGEEVTERVGGLFKRIYTEFEAVFNGEKTIFDVIYEGFKDTFSWVMEKLGNIMGPAIREFLYGPQIGFGEGEIDPRLAAAAGITEDGGFVQTLTDGFWSIFETMQDQLVGFWEGPNGVQLRNTISGFFENLVNQITTTLTGSGTASAGNIATGTGVAPDIYTGVAQSLLGETIAGYLPGTSRNIGSLSAEGFLDQAEDWFADRGRFSLLGDSRNEIEETARSWISETLNHLMSPAGGGLSREMAKQQIRQGLIDFMSTPGRYSAEEFETMQRYMTETVLPRLDSFSSGTSGFQNFGNESLAALHGVEAVVPRNTPAGDFLDRYFTEDWQAKSLPAAQSVDSRRNTDQENLVKYLIQLNSTMVSVLSEIRRTNEIEKQSLNSLRGLGGDMFRSI